MVIECPIIQEVCFLVVVRDLVMGVVNYCYMRVPQWDKRDIGEFYNFCIFVFS